MSDVISIRLGHAWLSHVYPCSSWEEARQMRAKWADLQSIFQPTISAATVALTTWFATCPRLISPHDLLEKMVLHSSLYKARQKCFDEVAWLKAKHATQAIAGCWQDSVLPIHTALSSSLHWSSESEENAYFSRGVPRRDICVIGGDTPRIFSPIIRHTSWLRQDDTSVRLIFFFAYGAIH